MSWFSRNTVSVTEAADAMENGAVLIDVRTAAEWKDARARGAQHIPLDALTRRMGTLEGKDVLVICRSGNRSGRGTALLRRHGITARNVRGGMLSWQRHQLPTDRGTSRSRTPSSARRKGRR